MNVRYSSAMFSNAPGLANRQIYDGCKSQLQEPVRPRGWQPEPCIGETESESTILSSAFNDLGSLVHCYTIIAL